MCEIDITIICVNKQKIIEIMTYILVILTCRKRRKHNIKYVDMVLAVGQKD